MMNKIIKLYCNEADRLTVEKAIKSYTDQDGFIGSKIAIDNKNMLLFVCSIFKVKNLKHDLELLNNIGIKTEMR